MSSGKKNDIQPFLDSLGGASENAKRMYANLTAELAKRQMESLALYEPLPFQQAYHACMSKECVLMKANRAGGSLTGFAEDARAAMGLDPYGKYPKENGVVACLGYGEKHIGRVIYRYLCQPGAFRIIKDEVTKKWRVYRAWSKDEPWNGIPGDDHRYDDTREAPPFIPERYIKNIAWERRSDYVFSRIDLINGWVIHAANTAGDPKQFQGFDVHLVHIDEDTASPGWYEEMVGRTAMVKGKLRWTALPHAKNDEMMTLLERAEDEHRQGLKNTVVLRATLFDNPYYPKESREQNLRLWKSQGEEVYRKRALGEMVMDSRLMYAAFSPSVHEAIKHEEPRLKVQQILTDRNGDPPADWCRYLVIDPGHSVCAALFFAVPPPEVGDHAVLYDELYIRECTATILADAVKMKTQDYCFQEFIIDAHGGRLADIASGIHPMRQYEAEFQKRGIKSVGTGSGFRHGSSDIDGRVLILRSWLQTRSDGTTKFLMISKRCNNTNIEFRRFKKKVAVVHGVEVPLDEGERRNTHAVECCEYAAAHGLPYVKPKSNAVKVHAVDAILNARKERAAFRAAKGTKASTSPGVSLGPK